MHGAVLGNEKDKREDEGDHLSVAKLPCQRRENTLMDNSLEGDEDS